jgi:hypothetical protein
MDYDELYRRAQADTLLDLLMDGSLSSIQGFLLKRVLQTKTGCWEWQGVVHRTGYGCFKSKGGFAYTHRAAYEAFHGPIDGKFVCHRCDNPKCLHPNHLFLGTHDENMADMKAKGRGRNQTSKAG